MPTFFSGTDLNTLKEEGIDRNHFVSLIVNNYGKYTAAITRKVSSTKVVSENITYNTFNDKEINTSRTYTKESVSIEWFDLKIEFENVQNTKYEELDNRLDLLKKNKEIRSKSIQYKDFENHNYLFNDKEVESTGITAPVLNNKHASSIKDSPVYINPKENEEIPYEFIKMNSNIIKSLVIQLITGSIILTNNSKIEIDKWMQKMPVFFEKRFGKGELGLKQFRAWADSYIEYICWFTEDESLVNMGYSDEELCAICAYDLVEELEKLPSNIYIKTYIDILIGYII